MELEIEISFTARPEDIEHWNIILAGLCEGECGAIFQRRMERFGEHVEAKLEAMMEEWPMEYFEGQHWQGDNNRFSIGFLTASDGDDFAKELEELFALCPTEQLEVETVADDD